VGGGQVTARRGPAGVGLWLLGFCSILDVAALALPDGESPPWSVAIAGAVLGVVSLVLVVRALRGAGVRWLIALRILSALSAVPAFVATDVPVAAVAGAAVVVVLNVVGVLLVAGGSRRVEVAR
jgi:hypothetical protein